MGHFFASTIGRKHLVGLSGLAWSLFLLSHMAGNLLLFVSPEAYNIYGHTLVSNPFIYVAELGLIVFLLMHVINALGLAWYNRSARSEKYAVSAKGEKKTTFAQKSLWFQGILILVFIVLHLITFKYGNYYSFTTSDGREIRDLHRLVMEVFQSPVYVVWYLICLGLLSLHLAHGVASSVRTLGFSHPKYDPKIKLGSQLYAFVVIAGFVAQPLYAFLG